MNLYGTIKKTVANNENCAYCGKTIFDLTNIAEVYPDDLDHIKEYITTNNNLNYFNPVISFKYETLTHVIYFEAWFKTAQRAFSRKSGKLAYRIVKPDLIRKTGYSKWDIFYDYNSKPDICGNSDYDVYQTADIEI